MKKLISLALAIVMIMCLSTTAFATTAKAPGNYTAEVTGNYVAGYESNGIVYCVDIDWGNLDFTYHAEKGAVWDPETLKYSEVVPAYWEGSATITVTNRSNTKISAVPAYNPAEGYEDADMTFGTDKLKVASAESGTAQTGTITVTPNTNGFLPAMAEPDTIGTITLTIAQDMDVTVEEAQALIDSSEALCSQWREQGGSGSDRDCSSLENQYTSLGIVIDNFSKNTNEAYQEGYQKELNSQYKETLDAYNVLNAKLAALS